MSTWEERAAEAGRLGRQVGTADADRRLLDLLLDAENTAVSQAAADAVLAQEDAQGLRLYAMAFGRADEDTRNKLGDCLYDDSGSRWKAVVLRLPSLLADADPGVRQGAAVLTDHMRDQAATTSSRCGYTFPRQGRAADLAMLQPVRRSERSAAAVCEAISNSRACPLVRSPGSITVSHPG